MRVLHVNKFLFRRGGAETYMHQLATAQREHGDEVAFFGMQHPDNPPLPYAEHFPTRIELDPRPRGIMPMGRAAARMLWSSSAHRGMRNVLDEFSPDVVHAHNVYHQLSPSVLRPVAAAGTPIVMTLHDYKLACPQYTMLADGAPCEACVGGHYFNAVKRACKDGSRTASAMLALESGIHAAFDAYAPVRLFIAPSRFLAGKMIDAGIDADRLRVLDNFVDVERIAPRRTSGAGIVYAGRLSPEKGIDTLIDALSLLRDAHLDVVGEGPARAELEARAAATAPNRVTFWGRLPADRVLNRFRAARVAALPARWYENQPIAVLEALACGVPIVATDAGGLPEIVEPGLTGTLVPMNDAAALAHALQEFLEDAAKSEEFGHRARARAEERFALTRHLEGVRSIYRDAA